MAFPQFEPLTKTHSINVPDQHAVLDDSKNFFGGFFGSPNKQDLFGTEQHDFVDNLQGNFLSSGFNQLPTLNLKSQNSDGKPLSSPRYVPQMRNVMEEIFPAAMLGRGDSSTTDADLSDKLRPTSFIGLKVEKKEEQQQQSQAPMAVDDTELSEFEDDDDEGDILLMTTQY